MNNYIDEELKNEFYQEFKELGMSVEDYLLKLEKEPDNNFYIRELFRPFHTIKGNSGLIGEFEIQAISQLAESVLDEVRQGRQKLTQSMLDVSLESIDVIKLIAEHRQADLFIPQIEQVKNKLQTILDSFNKKEKNETQQANIYIRQLPTIKKSTAIRISKYLDKLDKTINQIRISRNTEDHLTEAFDQILSLSLEFSEYREFQSIQSILNYTELFLTSLNLDVSYNYTQEKWILLNKLRDDLKDQIFSLLVDAFKIKFVYYNEGDDLQEIEQILLDDLKGDYSFIILNLNIHHAPRFDEIKLFLDLDMVYKNRIKIVQRYLGQKEFWHSLGLLIDNPPLVFKNFWQAIYSFTETSD